MTRELVLDTETTGLEPNTGDRIVEIGAVELINQMPTGRTYHQYINPERDMPQGAFDVHGLSSEFLSDKPVFKAIAREFVEFVGSDKMVIHNASFDMKFLNAELKWVGLPILPLDQAIDTLDMARRKYPGAQNSLDALCRRFGIDNSMREKHGALLDSEILAEVYLELLGGRQPDLVLTSAPSTPVKNTSAKITSKAKARETPLASLLSDAEKAAHSAFVDSLGDQPLWRK